MNTAISKKNRDLINDNWASLKCSPIGPFLQMIGIAPGNSSDTATACKASEFSAQFNSSMTEHIAMTNQLTSGMTEISSLLEKFRKVIASMEQEAFKDLSVVATQIFAIYVKIGNLFYIMVKNLTNIMNIFKATINVGGSVTKLLIAFIDLIRVPVNGVISFVDFFKRG